jgi:hypothetical protein
MVVDTKPARNVHSAIGAKGEVLLDLQVRDDHLNSLLSTLPRCDVVVQPDDKGDSGNLRIIFKPEGEGRLIVRLPPGGT